MPLPTECLAHTNLLPARGDKVRLVNRCHPEEQLDLLRRGLEVGLGGCETATRITAVVVHHGQVVSMDLRDSYDSAAEAYALHLADELERKPLDRHLLNRT
jgi:hypothetical protein